MAIYYGDNSGGQGPGTGVRGTSDGESLRLLNDTFTHTAPASWATGDVVRHGPLRAGEKIRSQTLLLLGDGSGTLGTTVNVGWAYVDGSSDDPDAFGSGISCIASAVDDAGAAAYDVATPGPLIFAEPPTNDRAWWLTVTSVTATSDAAGVVGVEGEVVGHG